MILTGSIPVCGPADGWGFEMGSGTKVITAI